VRRIRAVHASGAPRACVLLVLSACSARPDRRSGETCRELAVAGKTEEALSCLEEVRGIQSSESLLLLRGGLFIKKGLIEEAARDIDSCLELNPNNMLALRAKLAILESQSRLQEAVEACNQILALQPDYWAAWYKKGELTRDIAGVEKGAAVFHALCEANPSLREAWTAEAQCLQRMGRSADARQCINEALSLPGAGYDEFHVMTTILMDEESWSEALRYSEAMVEASPDRSAGWVRKARALTMLEHRDEALKASERALQLDPGSGDAWVVKGGACARAGKYEEALESWTSAERLEPGMYDLALNRAYALIRLARFAEAVGECNTVIAKGDGARAEALFYKGYALMGMNQRDEAVDAFSEAHRLGWKGAEPVLKQLQSDAPEAQR
jgi:tetratricopeptide (TPR) repeat protein